MAKTLVAYFSASGMTARLARTLAEAAQADLFEISPAQRYTAADLNWPDAQSRSSLEMKDPDARPIIAEAVKDMAQYDTVFVGFPIWWYQAPRIIETFLEAYDFSGKTVIPFATSGGSDMGRTGEILKACCTADTRWIPGKRLHANASRDAVSGWLQSLNLK